MEYVYFDFHPFGLDETVSSLDDMLAEMDTINFDAFEHLVPCISNNVVSGLQYLHANGVAHHDIKPGNVLVSNQHLLKVPTEQQQAVWQSDPCIAKLTDFGESWGRLSQTSVACTHTANIYKGTPAFMAPEIIDPTRRPSEMREEQL